jgi:ParB-like chromosome segregation protein Spo0J
MPQTALTIEHWPVDRLKAYDRNARTHSQPQIAKIAASITAFGFVNPVLVDDADVVIAGHGRLLAAHELKLETVPVIVLGHLNEAQRRAYVIADNRIALESGWDAALLTEELQQISELLSVEMTGFDAAEFEAMLRKTQAPDEFPIFDADIETQHQCPKCGYQWSGKIS